MAFLYDFLLRFPEFGPATVASVTAPGVPPNTILSFLADAALEIGTCAWGAFSVPPATWAASTPYVLGALVSPPAANGLAYVCTVAGNSAASAPTFPTTQGATVVDGGATWQCMGPRVLSKADTGQMWLAAHKLACSPFGQQGKLQLRPTQMKDKLLSMYGRTTYGQEYYNMLRSVAAGFRVP